MHVAEGEKRRGSTSCPPSAGRKASSSLESASPRDRPHRSTLPVPPCGIYSRPLPSPHRTASACCHTCCRAQGPPAHIACEFNAARNCRSPDSWTAAPSEKPARSPKVGPLPPAHGRVQHSPRLPQPLQPTASAPVHSAWASRCRSPQSRSLVASSDRGCCAHQTQTLVAASSHRCANSRVG
jgi:hypothetical protein